MQKKLLNGAIAGFILVSAGFLVFSTLDKDDYSTKQLANYSTEETENLEIEENTNQEIPPIPMNKKHIAVLDTSAGTIEIELSQETPVTSSNFVNLAKKGFYDNTIFHRVIKGFMIQGGDPNTSKPESNTNIYGTGGPGYQFKDEKITGSYLRGTVAMANSGPNTNGSQFFIMHQDYPLPKNYVIFGRVVKGIEVVDKIANSPVTMSQFTGEDSKPITPTVIKNIAIREE